MDHETSSYLMHHGVKGMKWGVRKKSDRVKIDRKTRKKLREEKHNLYNTSLRKALGKHKTDEKWNDLQKFEQKMYDKYGTDFTSKYSGREKKVHNTKFNTYDSAESKAYKEAGRITTQKLKAKYGSKKIDSFTESEERRRKAGDAIVAGMIYGSMGAMVIAGGRYLYKSNKK